MVQKGQPVIIKIGYVYDANLYTSLGYLTFFWIKWKWYLHFYRSNPAGSNPGASGEENIHTPGNMVCPGQGLGGWTINAHNAYDPPSLTLYMGDGSKVQAFNTGQVITRIAGNGNSGGYGFYGDGGPAVEAELQEPRGIATAPDGSTYISDENLVLKVTPDGIIHIFAGNGDYGSYGDGGPALDAALSRPQGLDVGPDGSLYIADSDNCSIRKVDPDGIITTVAGSSTCGYAGDGGPATGRST